MTGNFDFLEARWPKLYEQVVKAEQSVWVDVDVTAIRLRCFGELVVAALFLGQGTSLFDGASQFDRLRYLEANALIDGEVLKKFHAVRILGNKAAHGGSVSSDQAVDLLRDARFLAQWFCLFMHPEWTSAFPPFVMPEGRSGQGVPTDVEAKARELAETDELLKAGWPEAADDVSRPSLEDGEMKSASVRALGGVDLQLRGQAVGFTLRDAFAGDVLTPGQEGLIAELESFLSDRTANVFLLKGYAGTGKTFITKGVGEYLQAQGRAFCLTAPTGRAAKVIGAKSGFYAETVHKRIYDYTKFSEYKDDGLDGSETFKSYHEIAKNVLPVNSVFIVDEASLVSDVYQESEFFRSGSGFLLRDLLSHVGLDHNDHDKKLIFIGDAAQLPPIGMASSPALDSDYLRKTYGVAIRSYELKDVVRQKSDSGVMRNVQPLRDALEIGTFNKITFDFDSREISKVTPDGVLPAYFESCGRAVNGKSVIITRSNAEAAEFNRDVRKEFFPGAEKVATGDKLMVVKNTVVDGRFISNGDFIWVREAQEAVETREVALKRKHPDTQAVETVTVKLAFRDIRAGLRDVDGRPYFFTAKILENLLYDNSPGLGSDEQKALYVDFRKRNSRLKPGDGEFKMALLGDPYFNALRVKFGYALTCHKAQGSEWENVFVSCPSSQNPLSADAFRWLYTAMTRTTNRLYLLNPPHRTIGGGVSIVRDGRSLQASPNVAAEVTDAPVASTAPNAVRFGISEQDGVLFAILIQVNAFLDGSGIEIEEIIHNQYQEAYYFRRDEAAARLNIAYNSRGRVKGVAAVKKDPLGDDLTRLLAALIDRPLPPGGGGKATEGSVGFSKPFLQDYHNRLEPMLQERNVRISSVAERPWCVRYALDRDGEVATIDIWHNARSIFTTCQPVDNACTSGALLPEVLGVLTSGMSA